MGEVHSVVGTVPILVRSEADLEARSIDLPVPAPGNTAEIREKMYAILAGLKLREGSK